MARTLLRISEIAQLLGVTPKTVRHYHKLHLLPEPVRSEGGYRLYSTADLFHLRRIRRLQALGLSLQQIKAILDADDPDAVLHDALETLQKELALQQARIEARRERIAQYIAEGISLVEVEQPEARSPSYERLRQKSQHLPALNETLSQIDAQVFSQWDDFDLGTGYTDAMNVTAAYFEDHSEQASVFLLLVERLGLLETMSDDDPLVQQWADEVRESGLRELLSAHPSSSSHIDPPRAEVMRQIFMQSVEQHLKPAQRRFLELLIS